MDAPSSGTSTPRTSTPATTPPADGAASPPVGLPLGEALRDDGLKGHQGLSKFKDVDSLAKSYVELDRLRNERTGVKPLTADSPPEEVAAYRQAMGIPERPEHYELTSPDYPADLPLSEDSVDWWRHTAHKYHLPPAVVQGILNDHAAFLGAQYGELVSQRIGARDEIRQAFTQKYGAAGQAEVERALRYAREKFPQAAEEFFHGTITEGLPQPLSPQGVVALLEILADNGRYTNHHLYAQGTSPGGLPSKEAAQQRQEELWADYWKAAPGSPERKVINDRIAALGPTAHGR